MEYQKKKCIGLWFYILALVYMPMKLWFCDYTKDWNYVLANLREKKGKKTFVARREKGGKYKYLHRIIPMKNMKSALFMLIKTKN